MQRISTLIYFSNFGSNIQYEESNDSNQDSPVGKSYKTMIF